MKVYEGAQISNVAMLGHSHAGKTSHLSAMLYASGATPQWGRVDEGSTTTDHDEEELERRMSISTSAAYASWNRAKTNFHAPPVFNMFIHEATAALPDSQAALLVSGGVAGAPVSRAGREATCLGVGEGTGGVTRLVMPRSLGLPGR